MNVQLIKQRLAHLEEHQHGADWLPVDRLHAVAMVAKECVFKAQDELYRIYERFYESDRGRRRNEALARRLERRLAKVRAELEALDRDVRAAVQLPPSGGRDVR